MRIDIISVAPNLLESPFSHSIIKRAQDKSLAEITIHDLREFGLGNYKQIDDTQFGGGAGMVMMIEPIANCIRKLQSERDYDEIIYMTPDAKTLNQSTANTLSLKENILILTGHYKGVDQRIRDLFITKEISIGDYVLTGGELAAAVLVDAIVRLIPGVIGDEQSALTDSFQDNLLSPPVYTRPSDFEGNKVPEILLSGNFPKIEDWRSDQAYKRTKEIRPDLIADE
ncbi:tRNA (guanosine(37)-N1)-methyltransferase TrmD [Polaribacter sp. MSW13]|uniref:tRNA (guanine-N(1)-)-methyltransferase n=1 Tax=Polaribacter marinus TaxID=2916838 RepID=A0A9X2AI54_9FLAO|nr:tRNA (guanosine(37)-N1)-methyltransferase TrmD [Polaribacter marinus]MCI2227772.1 tRNA (guanosine(37)-N1)-methyltransferase TrmD [Polaribacter marinus]